VFVLIVCIFKNFIRYLLFFFVAYPTFQYPLLFPSLRMYLPNKYVHIYRYTYVCKYVCMHVLNVSKYVCTYIRKYVCK
jgi:hypothetical protein